MDSYIVCRILCEGYDPEYVFNTDETGLLNTAIPSKSMVIKSQDARGIKIHKERITVLLCVSATSEKLKPLVIGRSARPRCVHGLETAYLGVDDQFNVKPWMTSIFTELVKESSTTGCPF